MQALHALFSCIIFFVFRFIARYEFIEKFLSAFWLCTQFFYYDSLYLLKSVIVIAFAKPHFAFYVEKFVHLHILQKRRDDQLL